jgi:hypothetical protein
MVGLSLNKKVMSDPVPINPKKIEKFNELKENIARDDDMVDDKTDEIVKVGKFFKHKRNRFPYFFPSYKPVNSNYAEITYSPESGVQLPPSCSVPPLCVNQFVGARKNKKSLKSSKLAKKIIYESGLIECRLLYSKKICSEALLDFLFD